MLRSLAIAALCAVCTTSVLAAGTVTGWRNDGSSTYADATPPTTWTPDTNILWKTQLPSWANSSPILVGDRLFVTSEPFDLVCLDANDGHVIWQHGNRYEDLVAADEAPAIAQATADGQQKLADLRRTQQQIKRLKQTLQDTPDDEATKTALADAEKAAADLQAAAQPYVDAWYCVPVTRPENGYASATPVSDGERVCAVFGNGVVACYDLDGNRLWARVVEKPTHMWGHSASPAISGDSLLVQIRSVFSLDLATGDQRWRTSVPETWGSLALTTAGETPLVITAKGDILRVGDGVVVARSVGALDYATPTVSGDVVYFAQTNGNAVKLGALNGDVLETSVLWQMAPRKDRYYPSPLISDGLIYVCNQAGLLTVVDAANGQTVYEQALDLGGAVYPSPVLAGGMLFVSSDNGATAVVKPGRTFELVGSNSLEPFRGTPVFSGSRIYVRGQQDMVCIGATQ
jgi:outer membrane protein assembly factor BamB